MKTTIIDGVEVPIVPAKAVEIITNKTTGQTYDSIAEFNADVANPNTPNLLDFYAPRKPK
jgi:hypothetical protein